MSRLLLFHLFFSPDDPGGGAAPPAAGAPASVSVAPNDGASPPAPGTAAPTGAGVATGAEVSAEGDEDEDAPPVDPTATVIDAKPAKVVEDDPEWNGEQESLQKETWLQDIPEEKRARVLAGLRTKHKSWQRGFQGKFAEFSAKEKGWGEEKAALEAKLEDQTTNRSFFEKLLDEDDHVAPLTARLQGLEEALNAKNTEYTQLKTERDGFAAQVADHETQMTLARIEKEYPDIYNDFIPDAEFEAGKKEVCEPKGAYADFAKLRRAGFTDERAAEIVRADMKARAPVPDKAEDVPASLRVMQRPGTAPRAADMTGNKRETEKFADVLQRVRQDAAAEADEDD